MDVAPEQMGALQISIESEGGECMSLYASIAIAPAVVVEDVRSTGSFPHCLCGEGYTQNEKFQDDLVLLV